MPLFIPTYFLIFALVFASSPAGAQQKLDIIQIMGQFVQANYAASKCSKPDQDTLSRFLVNFRIVMFRAEEEMRKRNPTLSEQQVVDRFKRGHENVTKKIDSILEANGCSDARIQDLLKRFQMQANLKF